MGHSSYFTGETEATRNLGRIISGHYDQVTVYDTGSSEAHRRVLWVLSPRGMTLLKIHEFLTERLPAMPPSALVPSGPVPGQALLRVLNRLQEVDLWGEVLDDLLKVEHQDW